MTGKETVSVKCDREDKGRHHEDYTVGNSLDLIRSGMSFSNSVPSLTIVIEIMTTRDVFLFVHVKFSFPSLV